MDCEAQVHVDLQVAIVVVKGKLDARELARKMTEWSLGRDSERDYLICTGGGPGIMEAGNRGAADVEGGRSVGLVCI